MKKVLFVVDSFFQFIVATNLKLTIFKDDYSEIIFYNSSQNVDEIYNRAKKSDIFNKVHLATTPLLYCGKNYSRKQKIQKYFKYIQSQMSPSRVVKNIIPQSDFNFDILLFNSYGAITDSIFNTCRGINQNIVCYRFEEGFASCLKEYTNEKGKVRLLIERFFIKLLKHEDITSCIKGYYFFEPSLVQFKAKDYPILKMNKISKNDSKLIEFLNFVFDYKLDMRYEEKYIAFEDGNSFFSDNNEDLELFNEIATCVGKDNFLVKLHPRRKENRFLKYGIKVSEASKIPWEVILLNNNFREKVFITSSSAAAFSSQIYFEDNCKIVLIFKCMKNMPENVDDNFYSYMNAFKEKFGEDKLIIINERKNIKSEFENL